MEKIFLRGEIGWEILPFQVQDSFERAAGDDVEVVFSTPGGLLGAGLDINSIISSYKKENPKAQLIAHILEASSMGSHIASNPSFDMRTAEETSIAMIHNP
ncbi:ATP-dependent Clp protease proteolytic subunit, partial [Candidatus Pacearchaeota archaeon]|nr:ATP-dependent Clp protease proteolytic subunit [Candidatus Pacearchaeota archaeon]